MSLRRTLYLALLTLAACSDTSSQGAGDTDASDVSGSRPVPQTDAGDAVERDIEIDDALVSDTVDDTAEQPDTGAADDADDAVDAPDAVEDDGADDSVSHSDVDGVCVAIEATAASTVLPVDIIWIVDNSLSMQEEVELISANINAFTSFIGGSGIDYRVVMIAYDDPTVGDGVYHVCVPPPLSATAPGVCPAGRDVDGERYLHVREIVDSNNGLTIAIEEFPTYRSFLRPEAIQHLIIVSDDNAEQTADAFLTAWRALAPWLADTVVHSIVTLTRADIRDPFDDSCNRPGCPCGYAVGTQHMELSRATSGEIFSICEADWSTIFGSIAESVVEGTVLPCSYSVPPPSDGLGEVDPRLVNVFFTPAAGTRTLVPGRDSASECGDSPGWYWPVAGSTERLELCPASCGLIDGEIDLEFGCLTIKG